MICYLLNIVTRIRAHTREARELAKSIREIFDELELVIPSSRWEDTDFALREEPDPQDGISESDWTALRECIDREKKRTRGIQADDLTPRIRALAGLLGLDKADIVILGFLLYYEIDPNFEHLVDELLNYRTHSSSRYIGFSILNPSLARLLGLAKGTLRERFAVDSPLVQGGVVAVEEDGEITVLSRLRRLSYEPMNSEREIQQILFEQAPSTELEWQDFDHIASGRDHIENLIIGAVKTGEKGVNVLIHGPPGTGKTEFCKTLAERLEIRLFSVGESNEHGREPSRHERLQELRLAERVLSESRNSILLFDEMEDLLSEPNFMLGWEFLGPHRPKRNSQGSRVFMHRLLEQNAVPILWTSNSAHYTNPTLLRRMMYALELRQPSSQIRARIWLRQLERHGVSAAASDAETLARDFDVTPGIVDRAVAAARLIEGGDISTVHRGVESLSRLIHGPRAPTAAATDFDPSLVCANTDPIDLSDRLTAITSRQFSMCLQGPPGTGKSAFVRYLAKRLDMEVMQKRASDLLSMWVGETEKNVAEAFAEARDQELFLVFDEADSLLADRRFAHRNWEVSQVNEMLTWMESHPLPFACTTNYDERLDPATLRRFDFKLRLDYLSAERVRDAFKSFFRLTPPKEIESLANLTPGDFAVVRRRAEVLGKLRDAHAIASMLKEESDVKPERPNPIGFRSGYT